MNRAENHAPSLANAALLCGLAWLTALLAFGGLALHAGSGRISRYDLRLRDHIRDLPSALSPLFALEGHLGQAGVLAIATVLLACWLLARRARLEALVVIGAFIPFVATVIVKNLVQETPVGIAHPASYDGLIQSNYGFPSGHVVGFTVLGGLALAFAHRLVPWPRLAALLRLACVAGIVTVGFGRVYESAHIPTDAAAGYLLALLYLIPALGAYAWLRRNRGAWS